MKGVFFPLSEGLVQICLGRTPSPSLSLMFDLFVMEN